MKLRIAALGVALAASPGSAQAPARSVYTSLESCRLLSTDPETGGTVQRCPGVAGLVLEVSDDDARMSIDVVTTDRRRHQLNYWGVITGNFSSLGSRAEWRLRGSRPIALIVRVNAFENPERPTARTSYLAVARLSPGRICVTDRIRPSADANDRARRAADRSAGRPCLTSPPR
ncbi:MAG TPA: hypothetical protein VE913_17080 [Longimicrobium sp.]|nr:hypothetical protein [Longimicrobium sp.]